MIHLKEKHWKIINDILSKHPYQFYAYGSRVKGNHHQFSDLDLCYQEEIPSRITAEIKWEFADSYLPFKVELVNWRNMRPAFQKNIQKDLILISSPISN